MKFASLGSGSSGNATLVASTDALILVDCGFGIKETERRMAKFDLSPKDLTAIVVTHEHGDHVKGVAPLARKYDMPVYMTAGTHASRDFGRIPSLHLIRNYTPFQVNGIDVRPVVVPHDAREPAQFVFQDECGTKFGVLTDLGSVTPHIIEEYSGCHGLLVEANHDVEMLAKGPYPPSLKSRVASAWGHLNNKQTAELLANFDLDSIQEIVVGHISQKNNSVERVKQGLHDIILQAKSLHFACQEQGFDWLHIEANSKIENSIKA